MSITQIIRDAVIGNKELGSALVEIMGNLNVSRSKATELLFGWADRATEERLGVVLRETENGIYRLGRNSSQMWVTVQSYASCWRKATLE